MKIRPSSIFIRTILATGLLCLAGCNDTDPAPMFERTLERTANVIDIEPVRNDRATVPAWPRPREVRLTEPDIRVGFGTFLSLGQCRLLGEISQRNSSLGKFQADSGRLLYELRFHKALTDCIADLRHAENPDSDFIARLESIEIAKRNSLPVVYWNATFGSPEFRTLLNTAADPLPRGETPSTADQKSALSVLADIGAALDTGEPAIDASGLESHYYHLQKGKTIGPLLQAMALSLDYLEPASLVLETAAARSSVCPAGHKTQRGEYLFNVFRKYYIGETQPYLSRVYQTAKPLVEALSLLRKAQRVEPPDGFAQFYDATLNPASASSLWTRFDRQIARHTRAWQSVLKQCELMPGSADP